MAGSAAPSARHSATASGSTPRITASPFLSFASAERRLGNTLLTFAPPLTAEQRVERALELAAQTFEIEARALLGLAARQGAGFGAAVAAMLACRGRVIVMGMGKSGHVGRKIAATLASTGTPAFFVHPAEASHGDLGMVQPGDVVLAISNSGESDELAAIMPALRRLGTMLVAMTGKSDSTLARHADAVVSCEVDQEACPLNLAPTASTTAQMALGDALAVALLDARGFREEDFARSHPGGTLGRKLLVHVADLMVRGDALPLVRPDTLLIDMMRTMSAKTLGVALVTDADQRLLGIFTDGDLRRQVERGAELRGLDAAAVMHRSPRTIRADALAVAAAELMELHRITSVAVLGTQGPERGRLVGLLTIGDLMRAKVV
ncbi:MAG: KpsF/GutQ family sugar-phosphate isomerase [Betaproteobacteria bacterium]|nr:KpsF/GutQ family sugar-phosphate isomerase [Betaproteobacteria bacterium]